MEINSDPHRINQILSNLLNNAIKFTEEGHIKLQASLSDVDAGTQQLHFSVCDTGVGIAQENQPKLFTAFTQADASVATPIRRYRTWLVYLQAIEPAYGRRHYVQL